MFNQEAAFVPGCEYDVFVSNARDDNDWPTPPDKLADGWVHKFRDTLHSFLNQKTRRSGGRVRFFFDTQAIRQHEDFLPQVAEAVRKSAVMIVLLSDAWIGSEVCQNELNLFHHMLDGAANRSGRLIPVHLERTGDWPASLAEILNRVTGYGRTHAWQRSAPGGQTGPVPSPDQGRLVRRAVCRVARRVPR